ncbi:hypothetical protein OG989_03975 [Micromonospora sp. NBC_01740]|uniref:hypothetical protein n=1 Tax=Micromonospora sp. NBC_01740 TaxID=2975986 RepID=UPI002E147BD9|nr:hypothetical protein OG989_03975 [Micromonospora sp. NBC_01740]
MYGTAYDETGTTRVPAGEADYLRKAADLLDKASAENERTSFSRARDLGRLDLAERYAQLGAIQRGQMPASLARVLFEQLSKEN